MFEWLLEATKTDKFPSVSLQVVHILCKTNKIIYNDSC